MNGLRFLKGGVKNRRWEDFRQILPFALGFTIVAFVLHEVHLRHILSSRKVDATNMSSRFCDVDKDIPCVFDIGHNSGQDTRYYLSLEPPVRVVAVDANPVLMKASATTFQSYAKLDRLRLLNFGLTPHTDDLTFWVNSVNNKFSSFNDSVGCRDAKGVPMPPGFHEYCSPISVPSRTCSSLVHEFGYAEYIKIDIEGRGFGCLESILNDLYEHERPRYISIETVTSDFLGMFRDSGYNWFKAVDQLKLQDGVEPLLNGWSGPWGEQASDLEFGQKWISHAEMMARLPFPKTKIVDGINKTMWYDLHAKRF